jgi:DNA polymerase-3 subunit gamma/tau
MLGAVDRTYLEAILRALARADGAQVIAEADRMAERSLSFEAALQDLGTLLHRLALVQIVPQAAPDGDPETPILRELASLFTPEELQLHYQIAVQARTEIGFAPDEYAGFTMALLRMLAFAPGGEGASERARPTGSEHGGVAPSKTPAPATRGAAATASAVTAGPAVATGPSMAAAAPATPPATASASVSAGLAEVPLPLENVDANAWAAIVEKLGVMGMARMLAERCELARLDAQSIELRLPKAHERLLEKGYEERLKAALRKHFGDAIRISIGVGEANGSSPSALAERERERQQAKAIAEIEQDPFVRNLVENFDARVNENSIKPLQ